MKTFRPQYKVLELAPAQRRRCVGASIKCSQTKASSIKVPHILCSRERTLINRDYFFSFHFSRGLNTRYIRNSKPHCSKRFVVSFLRLLIKTQGRKTRVSVSPPRRGMAVDSPWAFFLTLFFGQNCINSAGRQTGRPRFSWRFSRCPLVERLPLSQM